MIKAVLLDLDNTLIHNPDRLFANAFSQAWNDYLSDALHIHDATAILRSCINQFSQPGIHTRSNYAVLIDNIADQSNLSRTQIIECLASFFEGANYRNVISQITPIAGAGDLITELSARNLAVVIATNPIYPLNAILARLKQAGLPDNPEYYAFISSAENMHYAKPNPAYFAEILGRVGVEPDEAIIIGDSLTNDIMPAHIIGMRSVYTGDKQQNLATFSRPITTLTQLLADTSWQTPMIREDLRPDMIIPQFEGNIGAIYGLLDQAVPTFWNQHPDPNEWSILQILCHLYTAENETQRTRLVTIAEQDDPFITAPLSPGRDIPICADDAYIIAERFSQARQETINFLQDLDQESWYRPARHSIFGITNLLEMAHFTAQHDRLHLNQLCQTIGNCD